MVARPIDHIWIVLTVALATYSQLVLRWQMSKVGPVPVDVGEKLLFFVGVAFKPFVLSALLATFLSGLSWMIALSKFELSYAFPFTALSFLFVIFGGVVLLGELLSVARVAGSILILAGILVLALHGREPSP